MEAAHQRSRRGCLACRQKRKKCDEIKPVCGRCKDGDDCIWPASSVSKASSRPLRLPRIQPRPLVDPKSVDKYNLLNEAIPISASAYKSTSSIYSHESNGDSIKLSAEGTMGSSPYTFAPYSCLDFTPTALHASNLLLGLADSPSTSALDLYTTQTTLSELRYSAVVPTSNALVCTKTPVGYLLDEDEEETFKTAEWLPGTFQLLSLCLPLDLPDQHRVQWSSAIDSYFSFFIRYSYDPSKLPVYVGDFVMQSCLLESVRLGTLGTSVVFYSYLNPDLPRAPLWKYAKELIGAAAAALQHEKSQPYTALNAQLAGISGIFGFYYMIGDLGGYMRFIERALPIVQQLVGTTPVSIHKLYGPETLDIRMFAWSDIFSAIVTSRPTRLVYDCNVDALLHKNQQGPEPGVSDSGLEWMCGLPDAFLLLTIQIVNLKHTLLPPAERMARAAIIETALRCWKVWPTGITNSVMRVQRISAQEIWRHFVILYLYQAIHKATPSHEVVQQSVRQIVKLASTLRPGHNPDCLLDIPYFFAGTLAISAKDRQFLRDRVVKCDIDSQRCMFANALDELWRQSPIDKHVDWTTRTPPLVMF
ncbi:unnamed protein product [Rhizoctonia solani]|uniref:Zn(2)-C6 fungal-type domain-containing protein n=1 Tax=Rhizoctonia solani TaxID=456999 RepID=A0A8H3AKC6_9AGAM|nr:unnamed protein product [Rhizoctonia solani]